MKTEYTEQIIHNNKNAYWRCSVGKHTSNLVGREFCFAIGSEYTYLVIFNFLH